VHLVLGSEIYVREDINSLKKFDFFTLNKTGKYLLMELPWGQFPLHVDRIVFELQLEGQIPIIAHPERSIITKKQLGNVENLVQKGALMQVNAGSLLGFFGRKNRNFASGLQLCVQNHRRKKSKGAGYLQSPAGDSGRETNHLEDSTFFWE